MCEVVLPELIACACTTGTFCTTTVVVVPLCMTERPTGSDVTPKVFPRVHACTTGSRGFLPIRVFSPYFFPVLFPFFFVFIFIIFFFLFFFTSFFLFFKYGKMKCFYNITQVTLDFKHCRLKKYG